MPSAEMESKTFSCFRRSVAAEPGRFPHTHPAKINAPPINPDVDNTSPSVTYAKPAPQIETVVINKVSSDADITFKAMVSKYSAKAVDINPVQRTTPTTKGSWAHPTNCWRVGKL